MVQYCPDTNDAFADLIPHNHAIPETAAEHQALLRRLQAASLVVPFDAYIKDRNTLLAVDEDMPNYLLLPEVAHLISAIDNPVHSLFIELLWQSGARISEALA